MADHVAIHYFEDLQDNGTAYDPGTLYPREGVEVSDDRLRELETGKNKQKKPLIAAIKQLQPKQVVKEGPIHKALTAEELEKMKVDELKELADQNGLAFDSKIKKEDLINLLLGK